MEQRLERIFNTIPNAPYIIPLSFIMAIIFLIGGLVLYKKRGLVKGMRWPGVTCAVLGGVSLVTKVLQYIVFA